MAQSVQQIVTMARSLGYASSDNYTDAQAMEDFNNVYHDLENDIVRYVDEGYYYDVQYTDLVAYQTEYVLPITTSSISGFKKIKDIGVKYINDGYNVDSYTIATKTVALATAYTGLSQGQSVTFVNRDGYTIGTDTVASVTVPGLQFTLTNGIAVLNNTMVLQTVKGIGYNKVIPVSTTNYSMDESRYRDNQSTQQPFYVIQDNSIWLYPVATQNVTNGLKIYTVRDQVDLAITDDEVSINLPWQYHNVISYGMLVRLYQRRGQMKEAQVADQKYNAMRDEMCKELSNRITGPLEGQLPPLRHLS